MAERSGAAAWQAAVATLRPLERLWYHALCGLAAAVGLFLQLLAAAFTSIVLEVVAVHLGWLGPETGCAWLLHAVLLLRCAPLLVLLAFAGGVSWSLVALRRFRQQP